MYLLIETPAFFAAFSKRILAGFSRIYETLVMVSGSGVVGML